MIRLVFCSCLISLAFESTTLAAETEKTKQPNILFILADQWRADALGYAGDPNVKTPHLDRLAEQSINFRNAVSGCPVCCPTRASIMTGQRPLTHGVFMNDVQLRAEAVTIAEVLVSKGYSTGYIGKWHLDGRGRSNFIPRERRQGFEYWKALECTHDYNLSFYYADGPKKLRWDGYDAFAQTLDAKQYIRQQAKADKPFALFLSWGPPHAPYHTAPKKYRDMYEAKKMRLRPNVPASIKEKVSKDLAGYYAHCTALDDSFASLWQTLKETGVEENTIIVFTADHGDLLGSHNYYKKQQAYDESIRVPMLFHYPKTLGRQGRKVDALINTEDLMPTLLGLCGVKIPKSVEGLNYSAYMRGEKNPSDDTALLTCPAPFGQWSRRRGGREYRGVRTPRYTYTRDLQGSWQLFDNEKDPYQLKNLVNEKEHAALQKKLDALLLKKLAQTKDQFLPGGDYLKKWGYKVDATGTVPYTN